MHILFRVFNRFHRSFLANMSWVCLCLTCHYWILLENILLLDIIAKTMILSQLLDIMLQSIYTTSPRAKWTTLPIQPQTCCLTAPALFPFSGQVDWPKVSVTSCDSSGAGKDCKDAEGFLSTQTKNRNREHLHIRSEIHLKRKIVLGHSTKNEYLTKQKSLSASGPPATPADLSSSRDI